jgi:phosphoesterase RecJ-like protein
MDVTDVTDVRELSSEPAPPTGARAPEFAAAIDQAAAQIRAGRRFLIGAHARVDGDALGAMLVSAHGLRALGKDVHLYNPEPVPRRFAFLPGDSEVRRRLPAGLRFDATLVHDCGARHLLGEGFPGPELSGPLIVLDHHEVVSDFGDIVLRDAGASSAGVIAWRLLSALGLREDAMPRELAMALFVSLVEDSGWFRYPGTNAETFRLGMACMNAGVSTWDVALALDESLSEGALRLLTRVLPTLERHAGGRLALLTLTDQMLHEAQAVPDDVGKLVNYARALRGVDVGALLTISDDKIYASLRGKGRVHLGQVASRFGGGGHRNAAGCTVSFAVPPPAPAEATAEAAPVPSRGERIAAARARLVDALSEAIQQAPP